VNKQPPHLQGQRLLREGAWVAAGQILSAIGALVSIRIMTELLAPREFGQLTLLLGVAALALGLSANPSLQAIMRYYPDWSNADNIGTLRRVGARMIARFVGVAAILLAGGWLAAGHLIGGAWFTGLLIASVLIIDSVRSFELTLLNAARRQRDAAMIYTADAWSRPLMAIAAVFVFGPNANAALAGYILGSGLVVATAVLTIRPEKIGREAWASRGEQHRELARTISRYALPLAPLAIFGWISGVGDRYVIGGMMSLEAAGLYAAAYGLASRPFLMLASIVEMTMRPSLYNAIAANDLPHTARAKRTWVLLVSAGAAAGVLAFYLLSNVVGNLLLGAEYRLATALMPVVALGYALYVVSNVFSRFCYAFDDTRAVLILTVAGSIAGLAVLVPAIHFAGLWGAAAAVPIRFGLELALSKFLAQRAEQAFRARSANKVVAAAWQQS